MKILFDKGYILNYKFEDENGPQGNIKINKIRFENKKPSDKSIERVSTPGSRTYTGAKELTRVLNGLGITFFHFKRCYY